MSWVAKFSWQVSERFGEGVLAWGCLEGFSALGEERKGTASNPPGQLPSIQVATRCDSFEQGFRVAEVYVF